MFQFCLTPSNFNGIMQYTVCVEMVYYRTPPQYFMKHIGHHSGCLELRTVLVEFCERVDEAVKYE